MKIVEHSATPSETSVSVQVVPGPLNVPDPVTLNVTVPPGVIGVPPVVVSFTVAVQVVGALAASGLGAQLTVVLLVRCTTVRSNTPELGVWSMSPL